MSVRRLVGWEEQHLNEISVLAVWRISFPTFVVLSSALKDLKLNGAKTPVWFYSYHPGQNGGILEYHDNSSIWGEGRGGGKKQENGTFHESPLAKLSNEMKAVYQAVQLCKGSKMHLSCFTGCRNYYPL